MTPDQLFSICNTVSLVSWLILIFCTFWKQRDTVIFNIVIIALAIAYAWIVFQSFSMSTLQGFGSLDGIAIIFSNKTVLLAGWIHYLAFDLLTGIYIIRNARTYGIHHWLLLPALFFTFLLGPVGLLIYLAMRLIKTKKFMLQ